MGLFSNELPKGVSGFRFQMAEVRNEIIHLRAQSAVPANEARNPDLSMVFRYLDTDT